MKSFINFTVMFLISFTATIGFIFIILIAMDNSRINGINPIGSEAVYISGEACTVNMEYSRKYENLLGDFSKCLELWSEENVNK